MEVQKNPEMWEQEREQIKELGSDITKTETGNIYTLTIIGQIEGHQVLPDTVKTTKYEHILPLLAGIEESDEIEGLLLLLNTVGGDIEAGLDTETTLGEYTSQMEAMGFNVLDANNQLRDQGEVIEEIGAKWKSMSREQQIALAQTMAGTRQYNNLLALFDNWGMYEKAVQTSANAAGTLSQ